MTTACRRDLACYRNDGHAGDHAYATPDTVPTPAPNWQAGYDAGYREAQEDAAMTTPREDAIAARMRRVLETIIESDLLDADEWLWLDKEVRAALDAEAETPREDASECPDETACKVSGHAAYIVHRYLASPETAEALARALTEVQGGQYESWLGRAPLVLAAMRETGSRPDESTRSRDKEG